jgi:hypothetical protein
VAYDHLPEGENHNREGKHYLPDSRTRNSSIVVGLILLGGALLGVIPALCAHRFVDSWLRGQPEWWILAIAVGGLLTVLAITALVMHWSLATAEANNCACLDCEIQSVDFFDNAFNMKCRTLGGMQEEIVQWQFNWHIKPFPLLRTFGLMGVN